MYFIVVPGNCECSLGGWVVGLHLAQNWPLAESVTPPNIRAVHCEHSFRRLDERSTFLVRYALSDQVFVEPLSHPVDIRHRGPDRYSVWKDPGRDAC